MRLQHTSHHVSRSSRRSILHQSRCRPFFVATWNVRSLVESMGDARVCRRRGGRDGVTSNGVLGNQTVDRKLDLLVKELKCYRVSVAGIQESKWFGSDVWAADGYTFLHSGRPLPSEEERFMRNEGVGIALDETATAAWRDAGEVWEAVSSRVIMARLKWSSAGQRRPGGSREARSLFLSVVSVYAPTAKARPGVKQQFATEVQDVFDKIPQSDILLLLGDFNARVGRRDAGNDLWSGTLGCHGLGDRNQAGEEFLQFCATNQLTVMNTWFKKRKIHLGTWMHPATKICHMIDYVVLRASQRVFCTDVRVMRGANCWSDHRIVRAKLRMATPCSCTKRGKPPVPFAVDAFRSRTQVEGYRDTIVEQLDGEPHDPDSTAEQNWKILSACVTSATESAIGRSSRRQPDWFAESIDILMPLVEAKNASQKRMLQTNSTADRKAFRRCQRAVKAAVDEAKEKWMCRIASDAEKAIKDGRTRWQSIRKLQTAHAGRRPVRPSAVIKEDGELTKGPDEVKLRWHGHFSKILNIPSEYHEEAINEGPSQ